MPTQTLIVSTRNKHKLQEIGSMLPPGVRLLGADSIPGIPEIEEVESTFHGNARIKATGLIHALLKTDAMVWKSLGLEFPVWVLADDSGLEVDALKGAPGVHSARFAHLDTGGTTGTHSTGNSSDADNNAKLLRLLQGVPREGRRARFRCVLALIKIREGGEGSEPRYFEGACEGFIRVEASGGGGFGYDPLFQPDGFSKTFAELTSAEKNGISHRGRALQQWIRDWAAAR